MKRCRKRVEIGEKGIKNELRCFMYMYQLPTKHELGGECKHALKT